MRQVIVSVISTLAVISCGPSVSVVDGAVQPAETPSVNGDAGRGQPAMDESSKAAALVNAAASAESVEGFTFHTYPAQIENIHLPTIAGNVWTATASDPDLLALGRTTDTRMPNGVLHHVVQVTSKKSGNAIIKFERRASSDATDSVQETRTFNFAIK